MPKNSKKKGGRGRGVDSNSDDESMCDNASVYSLQSENAGSVDDGGGSEELSATVNDQYEDKLMQALENATEKSAQTRATALQTLHDILTHRFIPEFIEDRKMTIMDVIEKSIRRGKGSEQAIAARLVPILLLQLGGGGDFIVKGLSQILSATALDRTATADARAKCCTALGLLNFLGCDDIGELIVCMQHFEGIFSGSYLKGDKTPSSASPDAGALHAAALSAWSLLLTLIPPGDLVSLMKAQTSLPSISHLMGMLQSPHLDVRMAAGETIALVLECGRVHDEDFLDAYLLELIEATKQLATDAAKYRAKRDRKTQRATFRDVVRYLEEDISPEICIRFGKEVLELDNWTMHHQYTALCSAMGPGMTVHLAENDFVRDVLQLGPRVFGNGVAPTGNKQTKLERHLINAAAFKARTKTRSKNRDKRSAVLN